MGKTETTTESEMANDTATAAEPNNTETPQDAGQEPSPVPYSRFKEVNDELKKMKSATTKAAQEAEAKRLHDLADQQKYQELVAELQPQAERAGRLEGVIKALLDAKLAAIPEDKRDLLPDGAPEDQLAWLAKAEAKGLFSRVPAPDTHADAGSGSGAGALSGAASKRAVYQDVFKRYGIKADVDKVLK
jgi:hypothetical protein